MTTHEVREPGMPIIRFEVEGMRHAIMHALSDHQAQMDGYVQAAIDKFCAPENLMAIINGLVETEAHRAIRKKVRAFFRNGEGREVIRELVIKKLQEEIANKEAP